MCGINGIAARKPIENIEERIRRMNRAIAHRGPNADTYTVLNGKQIALGHRRLSIIDLDIRSNQPFVSASGRWTIVYNGEIYNYKELRKEMSYPFKTESDTEVLTAGLEELGVEPFLKAANGMFAFAAYDSTERAIYLCRDRLGIKPLFYYLDEERLVFSSEIKGILNSGLVEALLDEEAIDDYMAYRYVREPYTFFQNILQIEAGSYVKLRLGEEPEQTRYWELPKTFNMETHYEEEAIVKEFGERLEEAVRKRRMADVPLGSYLSGGVDSSLLSAFAAGQSEKGFNTYTIGFPELNEFEYARLVAKRYQTNHHEIPMNWSDYQGRLKEVIAYKDAPLGIPNEIPLAVMSKELKKSITVVLSGEGADELLGGYGRIFRSPFDYANVDKACGKSFYRYLIDRYEYVPRKLRDSYLFGSGERRRAYDLKVEKEFAGQCNEYNVFHFFHKYHIKGLLQRLDTTTMLAGVEARVPFLDHTLIEYVYSNVPYTMKLRWKGPDAAQKAQGLSSAVYSEKLDTPKYLLKKLSYSYLPAEVIERKKVGFPVPLDTWGRDLKELVEKELAGSVWMKQDRLEALFEDCEKERIGNQILWMFLNMELFYQLYFTREWRY